MPAGICLFLMALGALLFICGLVFRMAALVGIGLILFTGGCATLLIGTLVVSLLH